MLLRVQAYGVLNRLSIRVQFSACQIDIKFVPTILNTSPQKAKQATCKIPFSLEPGLSKPCKQSLALLASRRIIPLMPGKGRLLEELLGSRSGKA